MSSTLVVPLVLAACSATTDLSEVPILDASPEQESAVRETLLDFAEAAGPTRIRLRELRFDELDEGIDGLFDAPGIVVIRTSASPDEVPAVVRHELCHALDHQERLTVDPDINLDDLAARFTIPTLDDNPAFSTERGLRGEVIARLCELEPLALAALTYSCPSELEVSGAAGWVHDTIWRDYELTEELTDLGPPVPSEWPGGEVKLIDVGATTSGDVLTVDAQVDDERGWVSTRLDRWTGEVTESDATPVDDEGDVPAGLPTNSTTRGWREGPAYAAWVGDLAAWSTTVGRTFAWTGEQWAPDASRCLTDHETVDIVAVDGDILWAWSDGAGVSWSRIDLAQ